MSDPVLPLPRRTFIGALGITAAGAAIGTASRASATPRSSGNARYSLSNGYLSLRGSWGAIRTLAVDPAGNGHYRQPETFVGAYVGHQDVFTEAGNADVTWSVQGNMLKITNIATAGPSYTVGQSGNNGAPPPMGPGQVYAQGFTIAAGATITGVSMLLATYGAKSSGVTARLYAGTAAQHGELIADQELTFGDNSTVRFDVGSVGPGSYVLELHDPVGTPSWWKHSGQAADVGGLATIDGVAQTDTNFIFTAEGYRSGGIASIEAALTGPRLTIDYAVRSIDGKPISDPGFSFVTPWRQDGYSTAYEDSVLFSRFFTDDGQLMPAQQLKRRPSWGTFGLGPADTITATGTGDYDVMLSSPAVEISGASQIDADRMTLQLLGTGNRAPTIDHRLTLQVRPHTDRLPDTFPEFTASDQDAASALTMFLHERTMSSQQNAGATNGADWKDWTGRLYDWTPGGFRTGERANLLSIKLDVDGYVWTWNPSGTREWPFPGGHDWDSRHFTTNPMYVLGAWRYYAWTGDREFLDEMLPRVRKAIGYLRGTLGGDNGLVTLPGPNHDGRPGSIGSNYWDITPFGHLDAYTNLYFCGCLEPAAQLEDAVGNADAAGDLRRLAVLARQRFGETFFDDEAGRFISCIDVSGTRHDYGSAFVNLEALAFGLGSSKQACRIFNWLEHGRTELTETVLLLNNGTGPATAVRSGHTLGQSFTADAPFAQIAVALAAADPTLADPATITLRREGPQGAEVGLASQPWRGRSGWMPLSVPTQQPGTYYVELKGTGLKWASGPEYDGGSAFTDGEADQDAASRAIAVVSPYRDGPADIYARFGWAPRATSRKNNFWYFWGWAGVTLPFERQLQDGGTDLYLSGFDVQARARYLGGDNAWKRLSAVVQRWRDPDHLCGGDPLFRGEHPQNESTPGSVGVDIPFPESGLAPNSFLEAILGVAPEVSALTVTPRLPRSLSMAGIRRMIWRGHVCELTITHDTVTLKAAGFRESRRYRPGETVRIPAR